MRATIGLASLLALCSFATPAHGAVRLGIGGDYWLQEEGVFHLTLSVDAHLARSLSAGGRFGALLTTYRTTIGAPIDVFLRATFGRRRVYLEGLFGPWILFDRVNAVRLHGAVGFGLQTKAATFGLEVGWLQSEAIVGLRIAWRI